MRTIKGPAIFLAQFAGDKPPFNSLDAIAAWAASLGYKGTPSSDRHIIRVTEHAFAAGGADRALNARVMGIDGSERSKNG